MGSLELFNTGAHQNLPRKEAGMKKREIFFLYVFFQLAAVQDAAENGGLHRPGLTSGTCQHVLDKLLAEMWLDTTFN